MLKVHGTGNTFYIIDQKISEDQMGNMAIDLCKDGTDGVLYVCGSTNHLSKMRIFNADGSEPEMCGNGLRCFARYELEKYGLKSASIETLKAAYQVAYLEDFYGQVGVSILLSPVKQLPHKDLKAFDASYPQTFEFYTVSNPHVVGIFDDKIDQETLTSIGLKGNKLFSEGINVNILSIIEDKKIYVQTYERGVGITKSCGTGMTASSVHYARQHECFEQVIEVYNDGGLILCKVSKNHSDYAVEFTGNATYIHEVDDQGTIIKSYDDEATAYQTFLEDTQKRTS